MKRVLCILLCLVMLVGMTACSAGKTSDNTLKPLRTPGVYKPGAQEFYTIQGEMYDYFLHLLGFGHITFTNKDGDFADSELLQFAAIQLSYEGKNPDEGVTLREINRTTTRYLGQKPSRVESTYFTYDKDEDLYYAQNIPYEIGQLMSLELLAVQEDGICIGEFRRAKWPKNYGEGRTDEEIKQDFLNGWYEGLDEVENIRMTFRERNTAAFGYYIEVLTIEEITE